MEEYAPGSIEDTVDTSIRRLDDHIKKFKERLILTTRSNGNNTRINKIITRKQKWKKKPKSMNISSDKKVKSHARRLVHGQKRKTFREETESLPIVVQNNAMTNHVKAKIYKMQQNSKGVFGGYREETIN